MKFPTMNYKTAGLIAFTVSAEAFFRMPCSGPLLLERFVLEIVTFQTSWLTDISDPTPS